MTVRFRLRDGSVTPRARAELAGSAGVRARWSFAACYGATLRSDAMWSKRLHREGAGDLAPERVAEPARASFPSEG